MMTRRWHYVLFTIWVLALATTPLWASNYVVRLAIMIAMYTALTLSWNFIGGFTGYPSFSTAAFFGLGCYAGALSQRSGVPMVLAWGIATLFVGAFAAALGAIILRLRGHYFAIGSIGVVEVVRLVVSSWGSLTGGGDGLNLPLLSGGPNAVARIFLAVMIVIMVVVFVVTVIVDRSRFGYGLRCIQQNEDAADMVGVDTTRYKVIAYTLSALFCGTVGAAYASWTGYIDPNDSFSIIMTIKVPVMCLLGGPGTVLGPVLGTAAFTLLEEVFWANFLDYNRAILGAVIVILIFFLPGGLLGLSYRDVVARLARLFRRRRQRSMSETILVADHVSRHFGGIRAVNDVSFALKEGEIVALIGPNGAGKTTLVNMMTGVHRASEGRIRFQGEDVTGQRPFQAARRGIARTFQIVQPFPRMSVLENVAAGALFGGARASVADAKDVAREQLELMGLAPMADRPASALTLAGRKRLELAKSMAMQPKLLMLDEVNAGLNASEIDGALADHPANRRTRRDDPHHRASDEGGAVARLAGAGAPPWRAHRARQHNGDRRGRARDRSLSRQEIRAPCRSGGRPWLSRC